MRKKKQKSPPSHFTSYHNCFSPARLNPGSAVCWLGKIGAACCSERTEDRRETPSRRFSSTCTSSITTSSITTTSITSSTGSTTGRAKPASGKGPVDREGLEIFRPMLLQALDSGGLKAICSALLCFALLCFALLAFSLLFFWLLGQRNGLEFRLK